MSAISKPTTSSVASQELEKAKVLLSQFTTDSRAWIHGLDSYQDRTGSPSTPTPTLHLAGSQIINRSLRKQLMENLEESGLHKRVMHGDPV
jgi:hypothetical protein